MSFSEKIKLAVKRRADFTCCWCKDRRNKVDVHHIIPQAEDGPDTEDNAATLCGSCHTLLEGNPKHRKELRQRRDHWYEECSKKMNPEYGWPIGLDVPKLKHYRELPPTVGIPTKGIQFTDKDPTDPNNPPLLYISLYFKESRFFGQFLSPDNVKWIYIEANMRFAFNLRIQVYAWHDRDVFEVIDVLRDHRGGYDLHGPRVNNQPGDYFHIWRENDENRLMMSTFTQTNAGISIHARFSDKVAKAFADYLEEVGFTKPFSK